MVSNFSSVDFSEFRLDCDLLCDSACLDDSSPKGIVCVRVRPSKLEVRKLQMSVFPAAVISRLLYQTLSLKLCVIWWSLDSKGKMLLKQCYKRWQGDRVGGAGAGIVMEMSTSRDLNAHLRAMQCAQRSFTQEMDRGRRQGGRPRHANNPRPPKHNVL